MNDMQHATHTCACGNTFTTQGWNNNVNQILRCDDCKERRQALIAQIGEAIQGKEVEVVYVAMSLRDLVEVSDFSVEISFRRDEKMSKTFEVVEL